MPPAIRNIRKSPRPRCFLCDRDGHTLYEGVKDAYGDASGTWAFKQCPNPACGLVWLDPAPVPDDLHLAYSTYFTHDQGPNPDAVSALRKFLYSLYLKASFVPAALVGLASEKRRLEQMHLDGMKAGRLLDVGCGDGVFLSRMREAGWQVDGVDFDARAIHRAKAKFGLELHVGDLKSACFQGAYFDAITLSHVLEHVPDPVALLMEVRRLLRPGGRMIVTTPNPASLGHQLYRSHWFGLDAPRHFWLFTLSALQRLGTQAGFSSTKISSSAARADVFFGASASIRSAPGNRAQYFPSPSIGRTLTALRLQYREYVSLKKHPDWGEEAVLEAYKS